MELSSIRKHWKTWANQYGTDLRATTKTTTAKELEINALFRVFQEIEKISSLQRLKIVEVGCGNGYNLFSLHARFPKAMFTGIDLIEEMIDAANSVKAEKKIADDSLVFEVGNVLELSRPIGSFDIALTDRCLINLNSEELQHQAIRDIAQLVKTGGYFLMIENSKQCYDAQNTARELVGLPSRTPAPYNHFFDEESLLPFLPTVGLELIGIDDFISLHDLVLYVLVPMTNGDKIDYTHPIVNAAKDLNIAISNNCPSGFGAFGQNRLYKCRKVAV